MFYNRMFAADYYFLTNTQQNTVYDLPKGLPTLHTTVWVLHTLLKGLFRKGNNI